MKISREGIVLIKSFEGFRPRAIQREDGGWVIGYGHTLSAREGAAVSEAEAELLLRYDLLPVEKRINESPSRLNQHQFDALVSFARSVGLERFESSDVVRRLMKGATSEAADALLAWPELAGTDAGLRRRAAERALFNADPAQPVALADLLVAPLALPPAEEATPEAEPIAEPEVAVDPRQAAVSALLGEAPAVLRESDAAPVALSEVQIANDIEASAPKPAPQPEPALEPEPPATPVVAEPPAPPAPFETPSDWGQAAPATNAFPPLATTDTPLTETRAEDAGHVEASGASVFAVQRYTPYATAMVGPLPFLTPVEDSAPEASPAPLAGPVVWPVATPPVTPPPIEPLSLGSMDDVPAVAVTRPVWTPEERESPDATDGGLFGEDLSLTQGGAPTLTHGEIEFDPPARFDWSETGAFIVMGAVGLTAFGASMAAFRLAAEQSGGDETTIIAWVLAVIGATCVGVSSFNLYRRWGLPGGDN